jgi:oligoendopeptidase F
MRKIAKETAKRQPRPSRNGLGALPEWNLSDLYSGLDDPAIKRDLDRADAECAAFEEAYKGRLADMAGGAGAGAALAAAVRRYEAIDDLMGRLGSYAGLVHAGNTVDPAHTKFYGDVQERMTAASTHLLFFTLELNRVDDRLLEAAMADPALGHYRPWLEDVRRYKPYQLEDRVEQLFHEKSMTAYSAWNRQFDAAIANLRFKVSGKSLAIEPTLNLFQDRSGAKRKAAAQALARTFKENVQAFALITNTLAKDKEISDRWRGFADIADDRHLSNRVEREVVDALVAAVRAAYPRLSHRYYALKAKWFSKKRLPYWDRNAPLPQVPTRNVGWTEAMDTVLEAYGAFSPKMAAIAQRFFAERWIDAPVRPGKAPGAFAHPTTPSAHPYVLLNYQGKPRDVMTLAHELGHGVHQVLAAPNGALMAPTPLTLAETASVFGEMLTFRRAARKPRAGDRAQTRLRDVLGLYPAFRPFAVLRLCLCVRRLPGEFALCGLRACGGRFRRALSSDAVRRRHQAPFRTPRALRPRRPRPHVLAGGPWRDRADDRGAGRPKLKA